MVERSDFGIERPHEYLASARGRECKLCLRDKDHPIHQMPVEKSDSEAADGEGA